MARLQDQYKSEIAAKLKTELKIANPMAVPRLTKVVLSMGTGSPMIDKNRCETAAADLTRITGQKAQIRKSRIAVSNFKTRRDMANGILDHVLEGLIGRGAFRLLPDDERDDEKEHPHEEADETKERGTGHRFEGSSCLVLATGFSERLDG